MMALVQRLRDVQGITVVLVEHNMQAVMRRVRPHHRAAVRSVIAEGAPAAIAADPQGDRGLSRRVRRRCCLRCAIWRSRTAPHACWTAVSLAVDVAESVTLIGANGAGKTSCLRAISGLVPLAGGEVWFGGERIDTVSPRRRVELGLVHVPEGKRLFPRMSVRENLELGAYLRGDCGVTAATWRRCLRGFRSWARGAARRPVAYQAASSRFWRSRAD